MARDTAFSALNSDSASSHTIVSVSKPSRAWIRTKQLFPIFEWLPKYNVRRNLPFDIAAGLTVAMMLIPQEVSLAGIMHIPAHNGLYTAATAPFVYALFGSSTVLSVSSGSEVSLLVGDSLASIKSEEERVAVGIFMAFVVGVILMLVRIFNLSQIADFFSRPVMGGFISAGGLLIMLSQVPNWLSVTVDHAPYPPQQIYRIFQQIGKTEKHAFTVGTLSILFLVGLRIVKKVFFGVPVNSDMLEGDVENLSSKELQALQSPAAAGADPASTRHGFSLTDQQYVHMAAEENNNAAPPSKLPKTKAMLWAYFLARTLCDLGPLMVCIAGAFVGHALGAKKIKVTGHVPSGFPTPKVPWYGFTEGIIDSSRMPNIILTTLTIAVVVYLSSIAMAKRLAIKRGEDINTNQELTGLSMASLVCSFTQAVPPTGGMSRTAVNLQNARTQLASIITVVLINIALYTLTGTLSYLPKSTLAAVVIVAGYSLVEFKEAKWLYRVKRDEFFVWLASFVLTLLLGVMLGLAASILSSLIGVMWKTKKAPVVVLGELDNGAFVDRANYPDARPVPHVVAIRVDSSLFFANCERVFESVDQEIARLESEGESIRGVVIDLFHANDLDATTIQVLTDYQEKLAIRKIRLAIANVNGRVHDLLASTVLIKRLEFQNPRVQVEDAVRAFRRGTENA